MRFIALYEDSSGAIPPHELTRRLETLLSLWRHPTPWHDWRAGDGSFASPADADAWASFVTRSHPVEPSSTRAGLEAAVRRRNAESGGEAGEWTLETVVAAGIAHVDDVRAGIRSPIGSAGATLQGAHAWRLSLRCDAEEAGRIADVCRRTFAIVEDLPGELSVGEPHPVVPQSAGLLLGLAFGVTDAERLATLWRKAMALGVADEWIEALAAAQQQALAGELARELAVAAPKLGWLVDLTFDAFADGHPRRPGRDSFPTRLDELLWAETILDHSRDGLAPEYVFGQMATAVALAGTASQIGNLLCTLPPGRAYFAAIHTLQTRRPQIIASLLAHVAFAPEAMFAMLEWPDALNVQGHGRMAMHDEWREVMELSHRLALFHDRGPSYPAALAWAAHEEARDSIPRTHSYARTPVPALATRIAPWRDRLAAAEQAERAVEACERRLGQAPSDADFVLILRLLAILESTHAALAARLTGALTDAYGARFSLSGASAGGAPRLARHGELLAVLDRVARAHGAARRSWRAAFDVDVFLRRSHEMVRYPITSDTVTPAFDCPRLVHAHAGHLLAAAAEASAVDAAELAEAFVQLFERTHSKMQIDAWGWDSQTTDDPSALMVRFAAVLMRLPDETAAALLDRIVDAGASELHLAELLWGFGGRSTLATRIEQRARRRTEALIKAGRIPRGHANKLGVALYYARLPAIAERYASYVLESLKGEAAHAVAAIRDVAIQVLLASWASQQRWSEIDTADLAIAGLGDHALVENLRALADLERQRIDEALARLERVLVRAPNDTMALVNVACAHAARSNWSACLAACERARTALGEATPPEVSTHEARAHFHLGEFRRAADALDRLPTDYQRLPDIITLRIALATATTPTVSQIEGDLQILDKTDPARADMLRARLAPLSDAEVGGGWFAAGSLQRRFVSFEERCATVSSDPDDVVLRAIGSAAQRIAEQPALARDLNEDQLTRMLCALLIVLERFRVYAHPLAPGGWGPKREGLADFALSEMSDGGLSHGRRIVRGEAKQWKGPSWMEKGLEQIFATSSTGQERFSALVVYSKAPSFEKVVDGATRTLTRFGAGSQAAFATLGPPVEVKLTSGTSVRVLKTQHGAAGGDGPIRTLYTVVIDVLAEPARQVRQGGNTRTKGKRKSYGKRRIKR